MAPRATVLFLFGAVILLVAARPAAAQEAAVVAVDPPSQTIGLNAGMFEVRIVVDDVTNPEGLGGYTLALSYDPGVLRALSLADTGYIASTGNASFCISQRIDQDAGELAMFCPTLPLFTEPGPTTTEPQAIARIVFEPVAAGASVLDINGTVLTDPRNSPIAATTRNGEVRVVTAGDGGGQETDAGPGEGPDEQASADEGQPAGQQTGGAALPASGGGPAGGATIPFAAWAAGLGLAGVALAGPALLVRKSGRRRRP